MNSTLPAGVSPSKQNKPTAEELYQKFVLNSDSYRRLHHDHSLDDYGTWKVTGECSDGYYSPTIGLYEGTLEHVIRFAVVQPQFWSYGSGGSIDHVEVRKLDAKSVNDQAELIARQAELQQELDRINGRLKDIS